jgi:Leucine-rich repeat (LRR) protein
MAVDDKGDIFEPSPDPLLETAKAYVKDFKLGEKPDCAKLKSLLRNRTNFGVDLVEVGLADKVSAYFTELTKLYVTSNGLTTLDLTSCTKLGELYCAFNQLTDLRLPASGMLHHLNCAHNQLTNLDSVRIYTDFHPRYGADPRATEDNVDRVSVDLRQLPDEGQRVTYRDRRYILQGFSEPEEFYNPDYSRHPLPNGQKDYRRTLYWNPNLHLDASGRATVSFCTGSQPTTVAVTANGQAADGKLLTN